MILPKLPYVKRKSPNCPITLNKLSGKKKKEEVKMYHEGKIK